MGMVTKLRRAAGLKPIEWRYLICAIKELGLARFRLAVQPTPHILQRLENDQASPSRHTGHALDLKRLSWAIDSAALHVPWRSDCLIQVVAARRWLDRHGIASRLYIGVRPPKGNELQAHAWLRCNDTIIGKSDAGFTPLIECESVWSKLGSVDDQSRHRRAQS